jgi:GAF domain-containing protein
MSKAFGDEIKRLQEENAALRRALDERTAELAETSAQQTATAEVLGVINASPGDLAPVFDAMLEKAIDLCEARTGHLLRYADGSFSRAASLGIPEDFDRLLPLNQPLPHVITHDSVPYRTLVTRSPINIADLREDDSYRAAAPAEVAAANEGGVRSVLFVPLLKDGEVVGNFVMHRLEIRPFSDKQIALLENFAAQAVIAMENARLITETREALEQQTATAEILQVINSSPGDLAPVFEAMLERARGLCGAAFGTFMLRDGDRFSAAAVHGAVPPPFAAIVREGFVPGPSSPIGRLREGEPFVHIPDLAAVASLVTDDPVPSQAVELGGIRTLLMVPLVKDGQLLGAFTNFRQEVRPFSDKQIALLQNFAAQAVIAMENARLITETREALDQQTATAEVLQVINASPGELQPVFDIILEKAMALCDVSEGDLELYDGNTFRAVATLGLTDAFAEQVRRGYPASDNPATRPLIAGERFSHIVNMADADFSKVFTHEPVKDEGHHTLLCVPLRREGRLLGMIASARKEVRPFSEKEIALLENFAQQAVIAIENARLLGELRQRTDEVAGWNRELEARVAAQVDELGRVGNLKRFLPPQVAEMVVSQGDERILESHRREIVVVFADVRGYTAFTETAEPEEVIEFLGEYHATLGPLITRFEGTLSHFFGDGLMVFFNDPVPCPDPAQRAVKMAVAMREAASGLIAASRRRGHQIGFGVGIAQGYATLGQIGFADRSDYTAIGTVTNLAARLCDAAKDGQILLARRVAVAVEDMATLEEIGDLSLKGLSQAVAVYNVVEAMTPQLPASV